MEQVLKIALSGAGLESAPEDDMEKIQFLDGALYTAMEAQFGSIPAALGIQEVKRILGLPVTAPPAFADSDAGVTEDTDADMAPIADEEIPDIDLPDIDIDEMVDALGSTGDKQKKASSPPRNQTAPVANPNAVFEKITRPVLRPAWKDVVVASKDANAPKLIEKAMKGAPVKHVDKPATVSKELGAMEEPGGAVLVIDCRPEIGFHDLIEFAGEPQPGMVIVWGDPDRLAGAQIIKLRPTWIQCHADVQPEDLGIMIRAFPRDFTPPSALPG